MLKLKIKFFITNIKLLTNWIMVTIINNNNKIENKNKRIQSMVNTSTSIFILKTSFFFYSKNFIIAPNSEKEIRTILKKPFFSAVLFSLWFITCKSTCHNVSSWGMDNTHAYFNWAANSKTKTNIIETLPIKIQDVWNIQPKRLAQRIDFIPNSLYSLRAKVSAIWYLKTFLIYF